MVRHTTVCVYCTLLSVTLIFPFLFIHYSNFVFVGEFYVSSNNRLAELQNEWLNRNKQKHDNLPNKLETYDTNSDGIDDCTSRLLNSRFKDITIDKMNKEEIESDFEMQCRRNLGTVKCAPSLFLGPLKVRIHTDVSTYDSQLNFINYGGWWRPLNCTSRSDVAIVVPYRDNSVYHLATLLHHIHPILKRQQIHYRIFAIEQDRHEEYCRGKLLNAGFHAIKKIFPYNCFVFHDVHLLPEDDRIDYACAHSPMHLSTLIDRHGYAINPDNMFGGVVSFTPEHFSTVNGYSNYLCTHEDEDKNMYQRIISHGLLSLREKFDLARYTMLKHTHEEDSRLRENKGRKERKRRMSKKISKVDGLNSVSYQVNKIQKSQYYTLIRISTNSK